MYTGTSLNVVEITGSLMFTTISHNTIAVTSASIFKPRFLINLFLMPVYSSPCAFSFSLEEFYFESSLIFLLTNPDLHYYKVYPHMQQTLPVSSDTIIVSESVTSEIPTPARCLVPNSFESAILSDNGK